VGHGLEGVVRGLTWVGWAVEGFVSRPLGGGSQTTEREGLKMR